MPEAGLKIAQKALEHVFCENFAEAPSLARVFRILRGLNPPRPPARVYKKSNIIIFSRRKIFIVCNAQIMHFMLNFSLFSFQFSLLSFLLVVKNINIKIDIM